MFMEQEQWMAVTQAEDCCPKDLTGALQDCTAVYWY